MPLAASDGVLTPTVLTSHEIHWPQIQLHLESQRYLGGLPGPETHKAACFVLPRQGMGRFLMKAPLKNEEKFSQKPPENLYSWGVTCPVLNQAQKMHTTSAGAGGGSASYRQRSYVGYG